MKMRNLFISVVVPAFNEEKSIARCLESLSLLDYPSDCYELIVVNNNSTDRTAEIVSRDFPNVRLVDEPRQGVVFARIRGVKEAQGKIIAYTDADCTVPKDWLTLIADAYVDSSVVAVGGIANFGEISLVSRYEQLIWWVNYHVYHNMSGYNMSFLTTAYYACGGFSELVDFGEDAFISQQLRKIGKLVILDDNIVTTSLRRQRSKGWLVYTIKASLYNFSLIVLHHPLHFKLTPMNATKGSKNSPKTTN